MAKINYVSLFPSPVIQTFLDENTDELKDIKDFSASNESANVRGDAYVDDLPVTPDGGGKRILEEYPRVRDIILDKKQKISKNTEPLLFLSARSDLFLAKPFQLA